jgi:hypothetical protein
MSGVVAVEGGNVNVNIDAHGASPDWYTHFSDGSFAQQGADVVADAVEGVYSRDAPLHVVDLGGGNASYSVPVRDTLQGRGYDTRVTVVDLNEGALGRVRDPNVDKVVGDITDGATIPRRDGEQLLVVSRAVEHYLDDDAQQRLLTGTLGRLGVGEVYMPQLSSGNPDAIAGFSNVLSSVAGKEEVFMPVGAYLDKVAEARGADGSHFSATVAGTAESEPRTSAGLARRYLGQFADRSGDADYQREAAELMGVRDELGREVAAGNLSRNEAIAVLDAKIATSGVYAAFEAKYTQATGGQFSEGIPITHPLVVLRKQAA